jgi:tetratricopeptide (TPR) repeat protein
MRIPVLLAALAFTCAGLPARAADTPGTSPNVRQPTVQERLVNARKAVSAKDWNGAMRELNVAMREEPRNADVHNLMGYTYRKRATPDMAKAYEHYGMALKFDPNHKGAHEYIGEAYLQDKRLPEAEQHLTALETICGGTGCEEYQDLAKAIADYKVKN